MKKPILSSLFPVALLALTASLVAPAVADNFTFSLGGLAIPDGSLLGVANTQTPASNVNVITGLTVTLDIASNPLLTGFNGDLYTYLRLDTPGGTGFTVLLNRPGVTAGNPFGYTDSGFANVVFSDTAVNGDIHLYQTSPAYPGALDGNNALTGTWQPDGRNVDPNLVTDASARTTALSSFNGLSAKGTWTLFAADLSGGNVHQINSWSLNISGISTPNFYWKGQTDSIWNTVSPAGSNWTADAAGTTQILAAPDATSDVIFSATGAINQNTTLGQDFTIHSLTIADPAAVTINSDGGGTRTLTIAGPATTGIDVQAGAGLVNIGANVTFALGSDTITVNNAAGLIIGGALGGANGLNKLGTGTLTLAGTNTYTGNTTVDGGGLTITGAVGNGTSTDTLTVGNNIGGTNLTVSGGGTLTNGKTVVGLTAASTGNTLNVTGAGSLWQSSVTFYLGFNGGGNTLTIDKGGTMTVSNGGGLNVDALVGFNPGADNNKLIVTDMGSSFTNNATLYIGLSSNGNEMDILKGGFVSSKNVRIGGGTGSIATADSNVVKVDGAGSLWSVSGTLRVGSSGTNSALTISNGAILSVAGNSFLGYDSTSFGNTVLVKDAGSLWNAAALVIGRNGTNNTVTVADGGTLTANSITLGLNGGSDGTLQIGNGAGAGTVNVATVTTGLGAGTVIFNHTDAAYTFAPVIAGTTTVNHNGTGTTTLTATNTYTGPTNVNAGTLNIDGSVAAGSLVNVATAGTLGGIGTVNGNATLTGNGVINFGATGNIVGTLAVTGGNWNGQGTVGGQVTSSSGNFNIGTGANLTATTGLAITGGTISATDATAKITGSVNYTSPASSDFVGEIAGAASTLTMNNGDTTAATSFQLSGNNTYGGVTTVTTGLLAANNDNALGATGAGTTVASGASLVINGGINVGAEALSISGTGVTSGGVGFGALVGGGNGGGTSGYAGAITLAGPATIGTNIPATTFNLTGGIDTAGNTLTLGTTLAPATNVISISTAPIIGAGAVVVDTGTAGFDVANTYTGSTSIINGGTLNANVAGALPAPAADGGAGTVRSALAMDQVGTGGSTLTLGANQAVASLDGAVSSTVNLNANILTVGSAAGASIFAGTITGAGGGLTKDGASTLTLSGINTYTGPTTVNGGTLFAASPQALGLDSAVTVNANSILDVAFSTTIGSLAGGGANSFVQDGPAPGPVILTTGTLNTSATYAGVIQDGAGQLALVKVGTGVQTLTGANTYTGGTTLTAGTLAAGNAKAFGSGNLTITGGTLRTTGGPLAVDIGAGNILFGGGTYLATVGGTAPGVTHDQLKTTGSANIGGGTLSLVQLNGFHLAPGDKVVLLSAAGGVAGGTAAGTPVPAANVTGLSAFSNSLLLIPVVNIYTTGVVLEAVQGSFGSLAGTLGFTPNQTAVAGALDSLLAQTGGKTGVIAELNFLDSLPAGALAANLDRISPEELTSIFELSKSLANIQTANIQRRLEDIRLDLGGTGGEVGGLRTGGGAHGPKGTRGKAVAPAPDERLGMFFTGSGEFTRVGGTANAAGFDLESGGITAGVDYRFTDHFVAGISLGYMNTTGSLANGGKVDVNGGRIGTYATWFNGGLHLDAAVTGGINSYATRRTTPNNTAATASPEGSEVNLLFAAGYDWKFKGLTIGPVANFQYTNMQLNGFVERGAFAPLSVVARTAESLRTSLGLHATFDAKIGRAIIRPEVRAAWQHESGDASYSLTSSFATLGGAPFTVFGPATGRDSLLVGAGVNVLLNDRLSIYAFYDGELLRTNYSSNNVSVGFRLKF